MAKEKKGKIAKFFSPIKGNWWFIIKPFLVSCIYALFSIATVEVFKYATSCIEDGDFEGMKISIIVYIGIFLGHIIFSRFCRNIGWVTMNYEGKKYIQREWLPKFFKLDNTYIEKIGTGKIQHIIDQGFSTRRSMFSNITDNVPTLLITAVFVLYQIYLAVGIMGVVVFILLFICLFFVISYFNKYAIKWRKVRTGLNADYNRQLIKMLMSKMEIVQNNRESLEIQVADDLVSLSTKTNIKVGLYLWFTYWAGRLFSRFLNLFILFYGILTVKNGGDISLFVGLIVCSTLFSNEFEQFTYFYKDFTDQFSNIQKLWDTFDEIPNMKNQYSNKPFIYKKGNIVIKNLYFGYNEDHYIFENFSLDLKGGSKIALVGQSGGGKSTLIKLIAGYLSPDKGNISIDGQDIGEVNIHDYFKNVGYLTQDPSVFDGTIYDNLIYALNYTPTDSQIKKIIKFAKCEFIYDFTDGLQTEVGERGIRLSGGQKQRLAIAKIMFKNPNIILLDEPTSALDSFNEEEISQALNNLFKGKTVIIVAHRLQTVKSADRILLFEDGKVIEDGTHQSLIRKNGKYKKMLDLQSGF